MTQDHKPTWTEMLQLRLSLPGLDLGYVVNFIGVFIFVRLVVQSITLMGNDVVWFLVNFCE